MSVWLSVDPLSHLNPRQTPYHFVSNNPVEEGLVLKADDYVYSSATDYTGLKGMLDVTVIQ